MFYILRILHSISSGGKNAAQVRAAGAWARLALRSIVAPTFFHVFPAALKPIFGDGIILTSLQPHHDRTGGS
jgi:hypothetical protein